jgi:UTP--glucose-1-phosphate uridylyltransferase
LDKPVTQFVVEEAISSGIDDIIITGRSKRTIEDYFDLSPELENHLAQSDKRDELEQIGQSPLWLTSIIFGKKRQKGLEMQF